MSSYRYGPSTVGGRSGSRPVAAPVRVAAAVVAAAAVDVVLDPVHHHVPLCPLHAATGWWCPLCGGLRSVTELAHGRLVAAWHDNALLVTALPLILVFWLDWALRAATGRPARRRPGWVGPASIVLAAAFAIARNLPSFASLRPV